MTEEQVLEIERSDLGVNSKAVPLLIASHRALAAQLEIRNGWNKLSSKELTDPEYIQAYIDGQRDSIDDLVAELKRLRELVGALPEVEVVEVIWSVTCNAWILTGDGLANNGGAKFATALRDLLAERGKQP